MYHFNVKGKYETGNSATWWTRLLFVVSKGENNEKLEM